MDDRRAVGEELGPDFITRFWTAGEWEVAAISCILPQRARPEFLL